MTDDDPEPVPDTDPQHIDPAGDLADAVVVAAVRAHDPAATSEIGDELGVSRQAADRRLRRLRDDGRVSSKKIGASLVWFLPREAGAHADVSTPDLKGRIRDYLDERDGGPTKSYARGILADAVKYLLLADAVVSGNLELSLADDLRGDATTTLADESADTDARADALDNTTDPPADAHGGDGGGETAPIDRDKWRDQLADTLAVSGDLADRRADAILKMYDHLRRHGDATNDELLALVDADVFQDAEELREFVDAAEAGELGPIDPGLEAQVRLARVLLDDMEGRR